MKNLIFFLFLSSISFAQTIEGVVLDVTTNKPVKAAHVYITNIEQGTITNFRGKFKLKLSNVKEIDSIYTSHIGYKKKAFIYSQKKKSYIVFLEPNGNTLSEVKLTGVKRKLNLRLHYNKLTSMKKGLYSFGSMLKDDKIYVIGGNASYKEDEMKKILEFYPFDFDDVKRQPNLLKRKRNFINEFYSGDLLVYDLNLDFWESADIKFRKRAYHNLHYSDNKFYVLGGKRLSIGRKYEYLDDKIEVFDNESNTIQIDDTNPHQAVDFASFTYDNKIIVMGGAVKRRKSGQIIYTDKVHLYDLESGFWYELASMPYAKETNGVLIENRIYLVGGIRGRSLSSIESFDVISGTWKKEGELFERFAKPAVTYNGDVVYMFEDEKVVTYNTKTKELNQYLIDLDLKASKLYYANNKLYILGGYRENSFSVKPSANLYSINLREFETTKIYKSKRL